MELQNLSQNPLSVQVQQAQRTSEELSKEQTRKSGRKKYLLLFVILLLCGLGLFLIFKGLTSESEVAPSPSPELTSLTKTETPEPTPTPTTKINREDITISVLNGTGIPKESSFLQGKLASLGYKEIEVGNADTKNNTAATVTFSSKLPESITKEITTLLESIYKKVVVKTASSPSVDVQIVTGIRTGQTPAATSSATPRPSASSSASPTPSTQ